MSTAAPAVAIPTRSEIEAWTTSHLADAASSWRAAAAASEDAFDQHRQNVASPGGTTWEGDAKDAALDRVTRDIAVVNTQNEALLGAADTAENAVTDIGAAKREVIAAIAAAEADDFTVGEDLTVIDNRAYDEETAVARATAAVEHAEDIRWTAERLVQADSLAAQQLQAKAADLEGIRFDGETETGGDPTIQLVDNKTETANADGDKPTKSWEDMLLPPGSGAAEPAAEGAPKPDAATAPDDTVKSALDEVAGQPVPDSPTLAEQILNPHTGTGKPGDPRYTKSPLESPIVNADPSVIEQQQARVAAAEQNLAAAQAAADSTARQDYMDGAGPGPRTGEAVPLAQDVFDARAELTEQRDLLVSLNEAAAETGLPTAAVRDLPANADVQAFPAEPPVLDRATEALTEGTKDAAKTAWDATMPDVANMYDVVTDYDNATDAQKQQAALDAAGLVPLPGAKLFGEGIEHGLDALGVAGRHSDDIPTGVVDDVTDTAGGAAHSVPDAPSVPHADVPPQHSFTPDTFDPAGGLHYASGDAHYPGGWPPSTPEATWTKGDTDPGWHYVDRGAEKSWMPYQEQVSGAQRLPDGRLPEYAQVDPQTGRPVNFDGHTFRGDQEVFLDAKDGYTSLATDPGKPWTQGMERTILDEVPRQLRALPDGAQLEIHVSDPTGAAAIRNLIEDNEWFDVAVIYTPKAP